MSFADLSSTLLFSSNLFGASLFGANLTDVDLGGSDLGGADLSTATLTRANLAAANLTNADLADADLTNADLSRSRIANANFRGATLAGASGLASETDGFPFYDEFTDFTGAWADSPDSYAAGVGPFVPFDPELAGWIYVPEPGFALGLIWGSLVVTLLRPRRAAQHH
jgi:uncharacterized protein YjbI with pentapeptide repeats